MKYRLIMRQTHEGFEEDVNKAVAEGWKMRGPHVITVLPPCLGMPEPILVYSREMTKDE